MLHVRDPPPQGRGLPGVHRAVRIVPGGVAAGKRKNQKLFNIPITNTCFGNYFHMNKAHM